jgi:L-aspartate oxidase
MNVTHECTTLVLGSGIAGLTYALKASKDGDVVILTKKLRADSNTNYAQGGVASVISDDDSFELHVADTLEAGAGLCRREAVELIVRSGPALVRELMEWGAGFSEDAPGEFSLGREGGHSRRRIVHAKDSTGRAIETALLQAVEENPRIRLLENHFALDLWVSEAPGPRRCWGATYLDPITRELGAVLARRTMLATGGCGKVYLYTTSRRARAPTSRRARKCASSPAGPICSRPRCAPTSRWCAPRSPTAPATSSTGAPGATTIPCWRPRPA